MTTDNTERTRLSTCANCGREFDIDRMSGCPCEKDGEEKNCDDWPGLIPAMAEANISKFPDFKKFENYDQPRPASISATDTSLPAPAEMSAEEYLEESVFVPGDRWDIVNDHTTKMVEVENARHAMNLKAAEEIRKFANQSGPEFKFLDIINVADRYIKNNLKG